MSDLSNDLNNFEQARLRAQRAYDALEPVSYPDPVKCDACEGTGKIGCVEACDQPAPDSPDYPAWERWEEICMREHSCLICKGHGTLTLHEQDWKDDKAEWDMDRGR